jgi:hypothetical protein
MSSRKLKLIFFLFFGDLVIRQNAIGMATDPDYLLKAGKLKFINFFFREVGTGALLNNLL